MHIIPVIDVRNGLAVRAVAGDRANYGPLETPLVADGAAAQPNGQWGLSVECVALGYHRLYPFETIYVADLDGIEGRGRNDDIAERLTSALPGIEVWLDSGCASAVPGAPSTTVIGSETLHDADLGAIDPSAVLSLDFRGNDFIGPPSLLQRPDLWPSRVIIMTLARVGTGGGPDLERIVEIARRAPTARIYAAGGTRDIADLRAARDAGAHGALIASALHAQKIKADDLVEIVGL